MPRAKINLGEKWESALFSRLLNVIPERIKSEPRTFFELLEISIEEAGGKKTVSELKRLYSIQFSRNLSNKSALLALKKGVKRTLEKVLLQSQEIQKSKNKIQIGKSEKHGFLYFTDFEKAKEKVKKLYLSSRENSLGKEVLIYLERKNCLPLKNLPCQRKQAETSLKPLFEFSIVEEKTINGEVILFNPEKEIEEPEKQKTSILLKIAESEFSSAQLKRNFTFSKHFLSKKGLSERKIKIDLVAFQPNNGSLHLCEIVDGEGTVASIKSLQEKANLLGVPAYLHVFAKNFKKPAEEYAEANGITLHKTEKD